MNNSEGIDHAMTTWLIYFSDIIFNKGGGYDNGEVIYLMNLLRNDKTCLIWPVKHDFNRFGNIINILNNANNNILQQYVNNNNINNNNMNNNYIQMKQHQQYPQHKQTQHPSHPQFYQLQQYQQQQMGIPTTALSTTIAI